jgi:thymidylate synthase
MIADLKGAEKFESIYSSFSAQLLTHGRHVPQPPHQMHEVGGEWDSWELSHVIFRYTIRGGIEWLQRDIQPNLPWAEDHFQERVSGIPHNPPPSAEYWPYKQRGHEDHLIGGKFSHTYPERMWPQEAGDNAFVNTGIRFDYGSLDDLVNLLRAEPHTRQAYLPIWFPEDLTAALKDERVPCTLGYHFMWREGELNMTYFIRSCDLIRFFRDDVYMACRLLQWVAGQVDMEVGSLMMHIVSLHCFQGDLPLLERQHAR